MNIENVRTMSEKKTWLQLHRNGDWWIVKEETEKYKWINSYHNEQHQRHKQTNLCRRK